MGEDLYGVVRDLVVFPDLDLLDVFESYAFGLAFLFDNCVSNRAKRILFGVGPSFHVRLKGYQLIIHVQGQVAKVHSSPGDPFALVVPSGPRLLRLLEGRRDHLHQGVPLFVPQNRSGL